LPYLHAGVLIARRTAHIHAVQSIHWWELKMKILLQTVIMALSAVSVAAADEVISNARATQLLAKYNCQTCHTVHTTSSLPGPSYLDIAKKYASDPQAIGDLETSVLNGSSGTWGNNAMPSIDIPNKDLKALIVWILQLM
jgi:cytochrome c